MSLDKYYQPMRQEPKYSLITTKAGDPMPFLKEEPAAVEPFLFRLE